MLNDIADADDADEFAVGNRGQMPHAVMGHQAHGALQGIVRGNCDGAFEIAQRFFLAPQIAEYSVTGRIQGCDGARDGEKCELHALGDPAGLPDNDISRCDNLL